MGQLFSSVLFACAVWLPQPSYLSWHWSMSMALRTICYAGSWDQVGVCHSQTHSFTLVRRLSPCDTTVSIKQHDTHHGRKGMSRGHVRRPVVSMLWFAPVLSWFPSKMVRQTVFATAVWFYCQPCNSCSCSAGDKRDADRGSRRSQTHTCSSTVTAGKSVTPQIVMRSLHPTQAELEPGGCTAVKQKRVQHVLGKGQRSGRASPCACPQRWIQRTGSRWHHTGPLAVTHRH